MKEKKEVSTSKVSCWACRYCDKESVYNGDKWVLTRTGYCLAEKSAVNGENDFYKKVYVNTVYNECSQFNAIFISQKKLTVRPPVTAK